MKTTHIATRAAAIALGTVAAVAMMAGTRVSTDSAAAHASSVAARAVAGGTPGLPADFPLAPALKACQPVVTGPEVICDWHDVDGHAVYTFYISALPKAGYTVLPGAGETTSPHEFGAIGFSKAGVKGAVTVHGSDVTVQVLYGKDT